MARGAAVRWLRFALLCFVLLTASQASSTAASPTPSPSAATTLAPVASPLDLANSSVSVEGPSNSTDDTGSSASSPPRDSPSLSAIAAIFGGVAAGILICLGLVCCACWKRRGTREANARWSNSKFPSVAPLSDSCTWVDRGATGGADGCMEEGRCGGGGGDGDGGDVDVDWTLSSSVCCASPVVAAVGAADTDTSTNTSKRKSRSPTDAASGAAVAGVSTPDRRREAPSSASSTRRHKAAKSSAEINECGSTPTILNTLSPAFLVEGNGGGNSNGRRNASRNCVTPRRSLPRDNGDSSSILKVALQSPAAFEKRPGETRVSSSSPSYSASRTRTKPPKPPLRRMQSVSDDEVNRAQHRLRKPARLATGSEPDTTPAKPATPPLARRYSQSAAPYSRSGGKDAGKAKERRSRANTTATRPRAAGRSRDQTAAVERTHSRGSDSRERAATGPVSLPFSRKLSDAVVNDGNGSSSREKARPSTANPQDLRKGSSGRRRREEEDSRHRRRDRGGGSEKGDAASPSSVSDVEDIFSAAEALALRSHVRGVREAATVTAGLVRLTMNEGREGGRAAVLGRRVRWCRSTVFTLERAGHVLGKAAEHEGAAERLLLQNVHESIVNMAEVMQCYRSKSGLSKIFESTMCKHRQDEADAAINSAAKRLKLDMRVRGGCAVEPGEGQGVKDKRKISQDFLAESSGKRRQQHLNKLEIPAAEIQISDEILGKGGFGTVYLADMNGLNAAAKVVVFDDDNDQGGSDDDDDDDEETEQGGWARGSRRSRRGGRRAGSTAVAATTPRSEKRQRKAFMRELEAMKRLRGPHTVQIYGAVTSCGDRLVLLMELLPGGDLRHRLRKARRPLDESTLRGIVKDVCSGMAFLHSKKTVHGDLKSANVLFDGAGRAKIADFGSSLWTHHSTRLASNSTSSLGSVGVSLPWAAPEVLNRESASSASDVYSFGMVLWECLTRKTPWKEEVAGVDMLLLAVASGERPSLPSHAPLDLADITESCWIHDPTGRPAFEDILTKLHGEDGKYATEPASFVSAKPRSSASRDDATKRDHVNSTDSTARVGERTSSMESKVLRRGATRSMTASNAAGGVATASGGNGLATAVQDKGGRGGGGGRGRTGVGVKLQRFVQPLFRRSPTGTLGYLSGEDSPDSTPGTPR